VIHFGHHIPSGPGLAAQCPMSSVCQQQCRLSYPRLHRNLSIRSLSGLKPTVRFCDALIEHLHLGWAGFQNLRELNFDATGFDCSELEAQQAQMMVARRISGSAGVAFTTSSPASERRQRAAGVKPSPAEQLVRRNRAGVPPVTPTCPARKSTERSLPSLPPTSPSAALPT